MERVKAQDYLDYIYAKENIGICYGLNVCRSLIRTDYILYVNDDMYVLPEWDSELKSEIDSIGHNSFMLSSTMIEPNFTNNSCVIVEDYGDDLESFDESRLLAEYGKLRKGDWFGSTWPPNIMHIDMWDLVGGMSVEFSPGMYSDPDLSVKLWKSGVRIFKGVGESRVYHFGSKSTKRLKSQEGSKLFIKKWGLTSNTFTSQILLRGKDYKGPLTDTKLKVKYLIKNYIKGIIKFFSLPIF